ncbi:flagellar motor switch protein FliM [Nocardioides caeni]|uniref:Flagellar motor switch protein FliM n=1 Tax=Nocardioides caeni TaxID=574700 RepID=A0A4S8NEL5_9ACTN|nr:flagellar motor switch protein FliM [Nocardioides caeni]THV14715.1 flagellar motor switch protein FliM [Nocardioides caeni]
MTVAPQRPRRRTRSSEPTPYDFRRPIQLSREHQRTLQLGFDGFARQVTTVFTSSLRTVCTVTLAGIEQRTYAEYVDSLGASTYMTLFSADPIPGTGVLEIPLFATMSCIDHMLGGPGSDEQPDRPLTEIEDGVIRGLVERMLGEMRYSLDGIVALDPAVTGIEYSPQFAQVASAADVMVVVRLELRIGEQAHHMSVCLPFSGLLPHLTNASGAGAMSDRERLQRAQSAVLLQDQFHQVPVAVAVRFRPMEMDPAELAGLEPGSVVRLSHPASAPLDVCIAGGAAGNTFAHATPGTRGQRLAALIVTTPEENS